LKLSPKDAFYAERERVPLAECEGRISSEFVMCYPPGIPILAPGELATREALDFIMYAKSKGSVVMGPQDMTIESIFVVK